MTKAPAALIEALTDSGLFDAAWYLYRNGDVASAGLNPLQHFIRHGWAEGRWPNRYFDPAWYQQENPGLDLDALSHYIRHGEGAGRRPHPLFDPLWYRLVFDVPPGQMALGHYLANSAAGSFAPSPDLFAVPYIAPYRDDPVRDIDPVGHYLDDTEAAGREPFPDPTIVRASGLVDENFYLVHGTDVHQANLDPSGHYCRYGWRENRRPNIYFDPVWYLLTNPAAERLGINPLLHYILIGEPAGRRPVPYFDPRWYRSTYTIPDGQSALGHYLANRRTQAYSPTPLFDVRRYVSRTGGGLGRNRDPFAHYLLAGMARDIDPSDDFDTAHYRRAHLGRPSRRFVTEMRPEEHNPLVHYLRSTYAAVA